MGCDPETRLFVLQLNVKIETVALSGIMVAVYVAEKKEPLWQKIVKLVVA